MFCRYADTTAVNRHDRPFFAVCVQAWRYHMMSPPAFRRFTISFDLCRRSALHKQPRQHVQTQRRRAMLMLI